jgi:hypothetical protein
MAEVVRESVPLDLVAAEALAMVDASDLLAWLERMPSGLAKAVLQHLGLRSAAKINRGMALHLLRLLQGADPVTSSPTLRLIAWPIVHSFDQELSAQSWAHWLGADHRAAVAAYVEQPDLLEFDQIGSASPALATALLCATVATTECAYLPALLVLATLDERVAAAAGVLRGSFPEMPPVPDRPLHGLASSVRLRAAGLSVPENVDPLTWQAMVAQELADPIDEWDSTTADGCNDPEEFAAVLASLLDGWPDFVEAVADVYDEVDAGRIPTRPMLDAFAAGFPARVLDLLRPRIADLIACTTPELMCVGDVQRALEILNMPPVALDPDLTWLEELTRLEAATHLSEAVALLGREVEQCLTDRERDRSGLQSVHHLLTLSERRRCGEPVNHLAYLELESAVRQAFPALQILLSAVPWGEAVLPADALPRPSYLEEADRPELLPPNVDGEATENICALGEDGGELDGDGDDHVEPTRVTESEPDTVEEAATEIEDLETSGPSGVAELCPIDESSEPELVDLDQLLADGFADRLSSLGGRRGSRLIRQRRPEVEHDDSPALESMVLEADEQVDPAPAWPLSDSLQQSLLEDGRFALLADLAEAAGAPAASVAARRLAALASVLRQATGPLAASFAELAQLVTREDLSDDRVGQLLAWAAAARIAVLAPSAGPAGVLLELAPTIAGLDALVGVGQALADAARAGIVVLPEAASAVGGLASAENEALDASAAAAQFIEDARRRTLKYAPANLVATAWFASTGPLGELLGIVAMNDPRHLGRVREQLVELRGRADRTIDATFVSISKQKPMKIVGNPRQQLIARWDEALQLAGRWVFACERLGERQGTAHAASWQVGPLTTLRHRISGVRDAAVNELDSLAEDVSAASGSASVAAASSVAADLLAAAFDACEGDAPSGEEPTPDYALHHELLGADLVLDRLTLLPERLAEHGLTILRLAELTAASPEQIYAYRATRGDHDLTAVYLAGLVSHNPAMAEELRHRRTQDVAVAVEAVRAEIGAARTAIDTSRMQGILDDGQFAGLAARVEALSGPDRKDFGRIRSQIGTVHADLAEARRQRTAALLNWIENHPDKDQWPTGVRETLTQMADSGQVVGAEEYLQQLSSGGGLPVHFEESHRLENFFPAVPDAFARSPGLLDELRAQLEGGNRGPAGGLDALATDTLTEIRRTAGLRAIGAWTGLSERSGKGRQFDLGSALRLILNQAGLEFASFEKDGQREQGRQWFRLSGVQGNGPALTPALGSAMSPDGASLSLLLVDAAPTPATLIEWMAGREKNRTVLVLWRSTPLSAADRRAIAEAARGRPQPPVLVLDAAALAFLVCQREPRRATFAEITLPFTAASPYRDTPGETPQEMFYGRKAELEAVLDLRGPSFVHGGRQLGKSALLRRAAQEFSAAGSSRVAVLTSIYTVGGDGDPERLWITVWPRLAEFGIVSGPVPAENPAAATHDAIVRWIRADREHSLLVLLDEADAFLDSDAAGNRFANVHWCRQIMLDTERRAKIVFAGLHRTARFESLPNQPLSHFGKPISIGPLRPQHAHDLLVRPLAALGFRFADQIATPARVLAQANNMPALLQIFGASLVAHLNSRPVPADGPPQLIHDDDIDAVFADADLREAFREKYVLNLKLDHRYQVIAYCVAADAYERGVGLGLSLAELSDACRAAWPLGFADAGPDDFRGLVAECVDLGVLALDAGRYRMRTPLAWRLLGSEEDVLETLYSADERLSIPSSYDTGSYRPSLGRHRSPLTMRQLSALLGARRETFCVVGSGATGIGQVVQALEAARENGQARVHEVLTAGPTIEAIRTKLMMGAVDGSVLVVDAQKLSPGAVRALLGQIQELVDGLPRVVNAIVLASPRNAAGWVDWPSRVDLARVDRAGLHAWCIEDDLPFRDATTQTRLLEVSGGWPSVLVAACGKVAASSAAVVSAERVLAELASDLEGPLGRDLRSLAGMEAAGEVPVLAKAFATIATLTATNGALPGELAELLELDSPAHAANAAESGFADLRGVVDALHALGHFDVAADGTWRAQQVLARGLLTADAPAAVG